MSTNTENKKIGFPLEKNNYILMGIGLAIIVVGLILMTGGASTNPNEYNPGMFSFRRVTLAPFLVLAGFMFEIYAILKTPKAE